MAGSKLEMRRVAEDAVAGMSGLTRDAEGRFWSVQERAHELVVIESMQQDASSLSVWPIEGVEDGTDLESIAQLDAQHFVIGTERNEEAREADAILIVALDTEVGGASCG